MTHLKLHVPYHSYNWLRIRPVLGPNFSNPEYRSCIKYSGSYSKLFREEQDLRREIFKNIIKQ